VKVFLLIGVLYRHCVMMRPAAIKEAIQIGDIMPLDGCGNQVRIDCDCNDAKRRR